MYLSGNHLNGFTPIKINYEKITEKKNKKKNECYVCSRQISISIVMCEYIHVLLFFFCNFIVYRIITKYIIR